MCCKLNLKVFVVLLALACSASAGYWMDYTGDHRFCNVANWDGGYDPAFILASSPNTAPNDVIIIDCNVSVAHCDWIARGQTFIIQPGATLTTRTGWYDNDWHGLVWRLGGSSAHGEMHIYGNLHSGGDWRHSFRTPDNGTGVLYVYPGADIWLNGTIYGAEDPGSYFTMYMSGGYVDCNGFSMDDGGASFYMTGGTMVCRSTNNVEPRLAGFSIKGTSGVDVVVSLDGGAQLLIAGTFYVPRDPRCRARFNLDDAYIECHDWKAEGTDWILDINEGLIRYKNPPAGTRANIYQWVTDGFITGYNGTVTPIVEEDGPDLIVACSFKHETAYRPVPENGGQNICLDAVLSWSMSGYVVDHNIYFGTSLSDVNYTTAIPLVTHWGPNSWTPPGPLLPDTTYYWRVDSVNEPNTYQGGIWEFTTTDGKAFAVSPLDNETSVSNSTNLTWECCDYDSFRVYFSADSSAVSTRQGSAYLGPTTSTTIDPSAEPLSDFTDYYWAVDAIKGAQTKTGVMWKFTTGVPISDPNLAVWYKLDELEGYVAHDWSGYENHGNTSGDNHWDPMDGQFGGSYVCNDDTRIDLSPLASAELESGISVSCWLKNCNRPGSDNWVVGGGLLGSDYQLAIGVPLEDGATVHWRAGNDTNDILEWDMLQAGIDPATLSGWHHWVFVKDEDAGNVKIYFDAELMDSNDIVDATLSELRLPPMSIGAIQGHDNDMVGKIDDFKLFTKALTAQDVVILFRGGEANLAWSPEPFTGQTDVLRDLVLSWKPGDSAVEHDVYFGTDLDAVTDANSAVPMDVYKGRQTDTNYSLAASLPLSSICYWRIDEVNNLEPNSPWKGKVWKFTVADYILIDDMESYDPFVSRIWHKWDNPWGSGSFVDLGQLPFAPVHRGINSMEYLYDNFTKWDFFSYWSESQYDFDSSQDWTDAEIKLMTIFFYGDADNDIGITEQFSVGIEGTSRVDVEYPDMNDLLIAEWQEWNIELSEFAAAGLTSINTVYLKFGDSSNTETSGGDGIVYFDDLRLYPPRCIPALGPPSDLNGDCIVDWADIRIIGQDWLMQDVQLSISAPAESPVGHWQLDEGTGSSILDSGPGGHNGTAEGSYSWITGKIGSHAIDFSGGRVLVPDAADLKPTSEVTAMAWINSSGEQSSSRVVVKGANDREAYELEASGENSLIFVVREDGNDDRLVRHDVSTDNRANQEWIHAAGSYDGNDIRIYINGQLEGAESAGTFTISQDTNDLAFGNRSDDTNRQFDGSIDDVRVYDVALEDIEIAYIATEGTGFLPLISIANLHDSEPPGQKAINFRDLAELLRTWLDEQLWPQ